MKKVIVSVALLVLIGTPALAQSGNSTATKGGVAAAPIGHRQPRVGDVPDEKNLTNPTDRLNKEDALLDKKIKSICRGC